MSGDSRRPRLLELIEMAVTFYLMSPPDPTGTPLRRTLTWHAWSYTLALSKRLERSYWRQVGL